MRSTVRLRTLCGLIKCRDFQWRRGSCLGWLLKMTSSSICHRPCLLGITCVWVCFKCEVPLKWYWLSRLQSYRTEIIGVLLLMNCLSSQLSRTCRNIRKSRQKLVETLHPLVQSGCAQGLLQLPVSSAVWSCFQENHVIYHNVEFVFSVG